MRAAERNLKASAAKATFAVEATARNGTRAFAVAVGRPTRVKRSGDKRLFAATAITAAT